MTFDGNSIDLYIRTAHIYIIHKYIIHEEDVVRKLTKKVSLNINTYYLYT